MDSASTLPTLLLVAWLLPLASFAVISIGFSMPQLFGRTVPYARQKVAAYIAIGAIGIGCLLSLVALFGVWLPEHSLAEAGHAVAEAGQVAEAAAHNNHAPPYLSDDWYNLAEFGNLRLSIGYYIDTLTVVMFCVVTLISTCVHVYSVGYMHDELSEFTDPEVTLESGEHLHRRGRFHRFFQYLSLFSFSMLGICIAGNLAMVFVFWELVGICSYFLIGFYIERRSACVAANKAFIVNRIGDFGMLIGLMAIWTSLGTFSFGDAQDVEGNVALTEAGEIAEPGIFSLLHEESNDYNLAPAEGMIALEARQGMAPADAGNAGQWLLFIAGVGIFCGCMGKSAQFPLHVWLPDAMEGPTPVSALVHSATMVAAGVFLVGRCYPIFSPEALLVIAIVGCITLFIAATIAITAVDIKRVLAYSTVSQLGYMMLALGLGGWVAGLFHLITHAFFKGLLFLCSGSVIHAVHTNDMREMGGLRKKMPITAYTMLMGCLAIAGVGVPFLAGFSGFHSKDLIIEQTMSHWHHNWGNGFAWLFFVVPVMAAAITSFYMFRLWYMTFAGEPRDHHRYEHAHESPRSMTGVLLLLAVFAVGVGWPVFTWFGGALPDVPSLLEQARPVGTLTDKQGMFLTELVMPNEHTAHDPALRSAIRLPAGIAAIAAALAGILLATIVYQRKAIQAETLQRALRPLYDLCWHKWWFDELYDFLFVRPTLAIGRFVGRILDLGLIDGIIHAYAYMARFVAAFVAYFGDRLIIDNAVDGLASRLWNLGLSLRTVQTGRVRQYVMFIVVGTIVLFIIASLWRFAVAG